MFVSDHLVQSPSWESIRLFCMCNFPEALSLLIGMCLPEYTHFTLTATESSLMKYLTSSFLRVWREEKPHLKGCMLNITELTR